MRTLLASAFLSLFVAGTAFAQETETGALTGTGSRTVPEILQDVHAIAPEKNPASLTDLTIPAAAQKAWDNEATNTRSRQMQHRRDCRQAIRASNRDTIVRTSAQCFRGDVLLDVNLLRKQLQYIGAIPQLAADTKNTTSGAILELIDAEMAIVDAIDAGVFQTVEAMENAKQNLRTAYRAPVWLALTHLRADQELTWVVFMVKKLEDLLGTWPTLEENPHMRETAICLEETAKLLQATITNTDQLGAAESLQQAWQKASMCREGLRTIIREKRQEEATES